MWWLSILLLTAIAGAVARTRGMRLLPAGSPKLLGAGSDALQEYAEKSGWHFHEGDSKPIRAEAWKVFKLAGPPALESLYAIKALAAKRYGEVEIQLTEDWQLDALLRRDTPEGPQTVLGCSGIGGIHAVIACVATRSTVGRFGLDAVGWPVAIHASGEPPEGIDFDRVLANLGTPLRLRFVEGTLLLRVPGTLSTGLVDTLLERLDMVRELLPRSPDLLGPGR